MLGKPVVGAQQQVFIKLVFVIGKMNSHSPLPAKSMTKHVVTVLPFRLYLVILIIISIII